MNISSPYIDIYCQYMDGITNDIQVSYKTENLSANRPKDPGARSDLDELIHHLNTTYNFKKIQKGTLVVAI